MGRHAQARRRGGDRIGTTAYALPAPTPDQWSATSSGGFAQAVINDPGSAPTDYFAVQATINGGPLTLVGSTPVAGTIVDTDSTGGDSVDMQAAWWDSATNTQQSDWSPVQNVIV